MSPLAAGIVATLRSLRSQRDIAGMRRFGIVSRGEQLGVSVTRLRQLGRPHRRNHALALELWETGIHEARVLAAVIDDPRCVTRGQMERWVRACDNWGLTDAVCFGLFDRTPFAEAKAHAWSRRKGEFVKRSGFVLMAGLAVHAKDAPDAVFRRFLPAIRGAAADERNFVKKAANWTLRQIGKRNPVLRRAAIAEAKRLLKTDSRSARWIARDALRELLSYHPRGVATKPSVE